MEGVPLIRVWARECSDFQVQYECTDCNWLQAILEFEPLTKLGPIDVFKFLKSNLKQLPDETLVRFRDESWLSPVPFLRHLCTYFEKFDFLYPCDLTAIYADFRHPSKGVKDCILEEHFDLVSPHNIRTDVSVTQSYNYERYVLLFRDY